LKAYWPWFVLLALCLFIVDVAVRQFLLSRARTTMSRPQPRGEPEPQPDYTYDELAAIVHRRAEDHRRRTMGVRDVTTSL
jgi:hypothetical protein